MIDKFKLTVKPDGSFEEDILSARGGQLSVLGKWKVSGETATLEGLYKGGPRHMDNTWRTSTLKKSGDDKLEGTRRSHHNNMTLPISYTKAK